MTIQLAGRLDQIGEIDLSTRLVLCASGLRRCKSNVCPRCSRRRAQRSGRRIERALAGVPRDLQGLLTLTAPCDSILEGREVLVASFGDLRRRVAWTSSVQWARGAIEVHPSSTGDALPWTMHTHLVLALRAPLDLVKLREAWRSILAKRAAVGSLDWRVSSTVRGSSPAKLAGYATKRSRREWIAATDHELAQLVAAVPARRWALRFTNPNHEA